MLNFTVADGDYSNALDYQQMAATPPKSPTQLVSFLNSLRPNTNAYVRVWRTDPAIPRCKAAICPIRPHPSA